jgi:hypothetical protein
MHAEVVAFGQVIPLAGPHEHDRPISRIVGAVANDIPVDIRNAPLGDALAAIYGAVLTVNTRLESLENAMADLGPALERLEGLSTQIIALVGDGGDIQQLQQLLEAERAANAALAQAALDTAATEDAEDVTQNAALAEAVAARDAAVGATDEAFGRITTVADNLQAAVTPPVEG